MTDSRRKQIEEVKDLIQYDPENGILFSRKTGKTLLSKDVHGYICFHALGKKWKAHRVIWFLEHGYLPDIVDHIDGDRENNHISNLREASQKQNAYNCEIKSKKFPYKGVTKSTSGKYRASIWENYKRIHLGYFKTPEDAARAYNEALHKKDPQARKNIVDPDPKDLHIKQLQSDRKLLVEALRTTVNCTCHRSTLGLHWCQRCEVLKQIGEEE